MKRIIALMGIVVLASCGGSDTDSNSGSDSGSGSGDVAVAAHGTGYDIQKILVPGKVTIIEFAADS